MEVNRMSCYYLWWAFTHPVATLAILSVITLLAYGIYQLAVRIEAWCDEDEDPFSFADINYEWKTFPSRDLESVSTSCDHGGWSNDAVGKFGIPPMESIKITLDTMQRVKETELEWQQQMLHRRTPTPTGDLTLTEMSAKEWKELEERLYPTSRPMAAPELANMPIPLYPQYGAKLEFSPGSITGGRKRPKNYLNTAFAYNVWSPPDDPFIIYEAHDERLCRYLKLGTIRRWFGYSWRTETTGDAGGLPIATVITLDGARLRRSDVLECMTGPRGWVILVVRDHMGTPLVQDGRIRTTRIDGDVQLPGFETYMDMKL